jgi:hypothetical protein
VAAWQDFLGEL